MMLKKAHLITQDGQGYGSQRLCCELCGVAAFVVRAAGESYFDDRVRYEATTNEQLAAAGFRRCAYKKGKRHTMYIGSNWQEGTDKTLSEHITAHLKGYTVEHVLVEEGALVVVCSRGEEHAGLVFQSGAEDSYSSIQTLDDRQLTQVSELEAAKAAVQAAQARVEALERAMGNAARIKAAQSVV